MKAVARSLSGDWIQGWQKQTLQIASLWDYIFLLKPSSGLEGVTDNPASSLGSQGTSQGALFLLGYYLDSPVLTPSLNETTPGGQADGSKKFCPHWKKVIY